MKRILLLLCIACAVIDSQAQSNRFSSLYLTTTPTNDDALTQVLVRDPTTGLFKYRTAASLAGSAVSDGDKGDITVSGSGATWTIDANINKAWTGTHSFLDNSWSLLDNSDNTKILNFQLSGITTGTTRTLTIPDASGTIALTGTTLSGYGITDAWYNGATTTLTGVTTVTSNAALQHIFNGTWTATANNDYHANFAGSFSARATASDNIYAYRFTPTLTANSTTQSGYAVEISPTFVVGGGTFTNPMALRVVGKTTIANSAINGGGQLSVFGPGTTTGTAFLVGNSSGTARLSILDNGVTSYTAVGQNSFTISSTWTANANTQYASSMSGTLTGTATTAHNFYGFYNGQNFTAGANDQSLTGHYGFGTYNVNSKTGIIVRGYDWNPTISGTPATHLAWRNTSGSMLVNGSTVTASTILDVRGGGTTTDYIVRFANSANTERFGSLSDGTILFSGSAGTSGQVLTSAGTGAPPTWATPIGGSTGSTDNAILRADGTGGSTLQNTAATIDDSGNITSGSASTSGNRTLSFSSSDSSPTATASVTGSSGTANNFIMGSGAFTLDAPQSSQNTVTRPLNIRVQTTSTPAAGIGAGINFTVETSSSNLEVGGNIDVITTDVTLATEDFDMSFKVVAGGATAAEQLRITSDGRLYGKSLHNNAGSVTGTSNQYIASGTYTPTLSNTTNVAASTAYTCQWIRVGNVVTVSGQVDIDATLASSTATELGVSLPIASSLTADEQLGGNVTSDSIASLSGRIKADGTNDRASVVFKATSLSNDTYSFTFSYIIL